MPIYFGIRPISFLILFFIFSCGGDGVDYIEENISSYKNGNKKVIVRFRSENKILERYTYSKIGELVYYEQDTLLKKKKFKNFLQGNWAIQSIVVNEDTLYMSNFDTLTVDSMGLPIDLPPNVFRFYDDSLHVRGYDYNADYSIMYKDSSKFKVKGHWNFQKEADRSYRKKDKNKIFNLNILSYSTFVWNNWYEVHDKNQEVTFKRFVPVIDTLKVSDSETLEKAP